MAVHKHGNEVEEDEDEEEDVNPKLEKLMSAGGVLAAILIVFIVIFLILKLSGCFGSSSSKEEQEVTETPEATLEVTADVSSDNRVPDVVGLQLDAVQSQLEELGLEVVVNKEASDDVEAGYIISQDIEEDTLIEDGMTITLTVSSGAQTVKVPDVTNQTVDNAIRTLKAQGFQISEAYGYSDSIAEGNVIKTNPTAGSDVVKGETIVVYVSQGPEDTSVAVPDLLGLTKAQAKKALEKVGLILDTSNGDSFVYSDTYKAGQIVSQSYSKGSKVDKGTAISVTYSNGPTPSYSYWAYGVVISDNPFNDEDESGTIKVILEQDGKSKRIFSGTCDMSDFPLSIGDFEGYSDSSAVLVIYLDDVEVGRQSVSFKKVAEG